MVFTRVTLLGLFTFLTTTAAIAQPVRYFIGAGPGISILSGGSGSQITTSAAAISNYEPKAGAEAHVFGGWHPWEYLSVQAAWSASKNGLTFNATTPNGFYRQQRKSSQHNLGADALLYFRERKSAVRPFLSVGLNHMWFNSDPTTTTSGALAPPPSYTGRAFGLRVAAGTDLVHRNGWGLRYAFMEHLQQRNVIGLRLEPAARRQLMTFQHIFGIVKYF